MTTQTEQALQHLKATITAFGPDSGIQMDRIAWSKLHAAIREALAAQQGEQVSDTALPVGFPAGEQTGPVGAVSTLSPQGEPKGTHNLRTPEPLSDEQIAKIVDRNWGYAWDAKAFVPLVREIERHVRGEG